MKKIVGILFAAVLAALLTGCTNTGSKFTVTGGGVESVHLGSPITAVANLTFSNPSYKVEVSNVSGVVKSGKSPLLNVSAEDFTIPARSETTVRIPVQASMAPGVGLLKIMSIAGSNNFDDLVVDLTFTASGLLGIKRTRTLENIPVKDIVGLL
ncbi:MAG: lipoprotein [Bacteroidales bacterium]|nr:lipoprotein [Bacteroidales bacterium]